MKKITIAVWALLICLVLVHYFYTPETPEVVTGKISTASYPPGSRPDLTNLWDTLVHEQVFSNESAVLLQLNQFVDKDGTVRCTQLYYAGSVDGEQHVYEAYAYPSGDVLYKDQKLDLPLEGAHPLAICREVTGIDYADLTREKCTIALQTFRNEGERRYDETQGGLRVLSNGSFRPLKEATFPDGARRYAIEIVPGAVQPEENTTAREIPDRLIAFTERDIALADSVVYA